MPSVWTPRESAEPLDPVLRGVDASPPSEAAVREIRERRDRQQIDQVEHRLLTVRLAGWQEQYPDVAVNGEVAEGIAAEALLAYGGRARLLVVGPRGAGGFTGLLFGSTSLAVLHRAPCPTAVVRVKD